MCPQDVFHVLRVVAVGIYLDPRDADAKRQEDAERDKGDCDNCFSKGIFHLLCVSLSASCCAPRRAIWRTSERCRARRPVLCAICSRQLRPSAMISQSAGAWRTAGRSSSSPMAIEISYLSASKPKEPAMPQHPGAGLWKTIPNRLRTDSSAVIFIRDL